MKICLFSDIHGNSYAFDAALPKILAERADMNIFLGDICGYYFDEIEIFERLTAIPKLTAIAGNHDRMFLAAAFGDETVREEYRGRYGSSIDHFLSADHGKMARWLATLENSFELRGEKTVCYHASPWQLTEGYVYPDSPLDEFLKWTPQNFFLGHTHYPMSRMIGDKWVVNPGSLGQPRAGGWPTYAIIELPQRRVEFREVVYDKMPLLARIEFLGEQKPYLREVLLREKKA